MYNSRRSPLFTNIPTSPIHENRLTFAVKFNLVRIISLYRNRIGFLLGVHLPNSIDSVCAETSAYYLVLPRSDREDMLNRGLTNLTSPRLSQNSGTASVTRPHSTTLTRFRSNRKEYAARAIPSQFGSLFQLPWARGRGRPLLGPREPAQSPLAGLMASA